MFHDCSLVALRPGYLSKLLTASGSRLVIRSVVDDWPIFFFLLLLSVASLPACLPAHTTIRYHPSTHLGPPLRLAFFFFLLCSRAFRLYHDKGSLWTSESSLSAYLPSTRDDDPELGFYVRRCAELLVQSSLKHEGEISLSPFSLCRRLPSEILFSELISFHFAAQRR